MKRTSRGHVRLRNVRTHFCVVIFQTLSSPTSVATETIYVSLVVTLNNPEKICLGVVVGSSGDLASSLSKQSLDGTKLHTGASQPA